MQQVSITPDPNMPTYTVRVNSSTDGFAGVGITLGITEKYQTLPDGLDALIQDFAAAMTAWAGCDSVTVTRTALVETDITPTSPGA